MLENLTDIEKQVILKMAREGPKTGYDLHLGGHRQRAGREAIISSGSWVKVKKNLLSRGLIEKLPKKEDAGGSLGERGRKRELYWLTNEGIFMALIHGADPDILLKLAQENLNEAEFLKRTLSIKIAKILGLEALITLYISFQYHGFPVIIPSLFDEQKLREVLKLLMAYPEYRKVLETLPQAWEQILQKLES